ncbi:ComEC/Rec2 family competence protein [Nocardioides aestuarii]|uniref:ComEC/Rec2 family competence protein n=1 Tax=Nocardioides aestuarii TaxID=252231 RepID=A0ABW4TSM4_9ACTN
MTDLRMPALALAAWAGGLSVLLPGPVTALVLLVGLLAARWRGSRALVAAVLVLGAVAAGATVREARVAHDPVAWLAAERAVVEAEAVITSDPRALRSGFTDGVVLRATVVRVAGRGVAYEVRAPVLLLADASWTGVPLGARVRLTARLSPAEERGDPLSAVAAATGEPSVVAAPGPWWRGAAAVRGSLRDSVAHRPDAQAALVPALVVGDDAALDEALADDFRVTGLTHLLAVSGTNLTLVVGFLLLAGRWCGVRGGGHYVVGAVGIVGFVLLARTEPSVVRAAAMGTVALVGMGVDGRRRGTRALGVAVVGLLLLDPSLALSPGFALSTLATGGILMLGPGLRDALARWTPRWVAEAVSVPLAAQLACTPVVAALSAQVSLVAVGTNLLVSPAVGPATVLGLVGGLVGLISDPAGRLLGTLAGWCVAWIVAVARRGAALPTAALDWGTGPVALAVLTLLVGGLALLLPRLLARAVGGVGCCLLVVVSVLVRPPTPGWPPDGWVMVACDVGQGDALVLRAGPGSAVVVDAGPDPALVDRCLDRLDVARVPLLVLTHPHADHVDGRVGVADGRVVGATETTGSASYGTTRRVGELTLQVLWPPPAAHPDNPNDASVVLLVEVRGVRLLLTGDVEPPSQAAIARAWPGLSVDVVKVPHHGSRHQDVGWLTGLGARVAVVSVGADNDYGHPSPDALDPLVGTGAEALRTDLDGDVAVTVEEGGLGVATSR